MLAGSGIMRNNLEMLLARGKLQVTQLCVPHEGNPPVLMRRPSIFNLETVPSVNGRRGGVSPPVPAGPLKTKGGREQWAARAQCGALQRCRYRTTNLRTYVNTESSSEYLLLGYSLVTVRYSASSCESPAERAAAWVSWCNKNDLDSPHWVYFVGRSIGKNSPNPVLVLKWRVHTNIDFFFTTCSYFSFFS